MNTSRASQGFHILGLTVLAVAGCTHGSSRDSAPDAGVIAQGKQIFRFDTFGDESKWSDALRMHEVIRSAVDPKTALAVGLKVDAEALPPAVVKGIQDGSVSLTSPDTTVALLKLDAVVGLKGTVANVNGKDTLQAKNILIATGSEIELVTKAADALAEQGIAVRIVSMPCTDVFDRQDASYKASVLTKGIPRVAVEAGVSDFWYKYVGLEGAVIGIDTFGESAPAGVLFKHFGFTTEKVVDTVKMVLA